MDGAITSGHDGTEAPLCARRLRASESGDLNSLFIDEGGPWLRAMSTARGRVLDTDSLLVVTVTVVFRVSSCDASQQFLFDFVGELQSDWIVTFGKLLADIARVGPR